MCDSNRNPVVSPNGCFVPRQAGRLTVGRNILVRLRLRQLVVSYSDSEGSRELTDEVVGWQLEVSPAWELEAEESIG
jgi:hypothetical protein